MTKYGPPFAPTFPKTKAHGGTRRKIYDYKSHSLRIYRYAKAARRHPWIPLSKDGLSTSSTSTPNRYRLYQTGIPRHRHSQLEGEFNGTDVHVYIATNNNKVYRIMLCDANTQNEANIKIRFNKLVSQFENNKRYTSLDKYTLSDEENISYEMTVNKKNYDALFYQVPNMEKVDTLALQKKVRNELLSKYTEAELKNPSEEITKEIQNTAIKIGMEMMFMKPVWFRICESYGEYYITMFYDNEYNHANGEDL